MAGKQSRDKGKRGERAVAKLFRKWFPNAKRSFGQVREGYEQPDITGSGIEYMFFIEVKSYSRFSTLKRRQAFTKAINDRNKFRIVSKIQFVPMVVLIWKETGQRDWKVTLNKYGLDYLDVEIIKEPINGLLYDISWSDFEKLVDHKKSGDL